MRALPVQLQQPLVQDPSEQQLVVHELWQRQAQALSFGSSIPRDHSRVSPGAQRLPRRPHTARTTGEGQRWLVGTPNPPRGAKLPTPTAAELVWPEQGWAEPGNTLKTLGAAVLEQGAGLDTPPCSPQGSAPAADGPQGKRREQNTPAQGCSCRQQLPILLGSTSHLYRCTSCIGNHSFFWEAVSG